MRKIVVVASYIGRTGSSALMGMLNNLGFNLGKSLKSKADSNNVKGYFELTSQDSLLASLFPQFYSVNAERADTAPTAKDIDKIFTTAYSNMPSFYNFLDNEFGTSNQPIAIKDIRLLLLPFLFGARNKFDIKVIFLDRDVLGRATSVFQLLHNSGANLAAVDRNSKVDYIKQWKAFGYEFKNRISQLPILDVRFERFIANSNGTLQSIANFIELPINDVLKAHSFVEPHLAKRRAAHPHLNCFYGQNGEDAVLWSLFKSGYHGKYVDVGSLDGRLFSNTYSFELADWEGICVEAHPHFIPWLKRNRPNAHVFHAAATDHEGEVQFEAYPRGSLSTINTSDLPYLQKRFKVPNNWESITVPARTVTSMLEEAGIRSSVDVVSIDVEGAEINVLRGFDLQRYQPRILVLEHLTPAKNAEVKNYLSGFGYTAAAELSNNTFYCKKEDVVAIQRARKELNVAPIITKHPLETK